VSKKVVYVGVDVGQEELVACMEGSKPRCFRHNADGIRKMYSWSRNVAGDTELCFCLEATGVYGYSLATSLVKRFGVRVSVVNPARIASFAKAQLRRTKTDNIDARVILAFAQSQNPPCWKPESETQRRLYQLVTQADRLRRMKRQLSNRDHGFKYVPDLPQEIRKSQRSLHRSIERQLANIEKAIEQLCVQDHLLEEQMNLLCSIPGVGTHSAVRILAYGKGNLIELNRKSLIAHAGLAPSEKQSGISIRGKTRIAKQGDRRLRSALYMPALVAAHHNPVLKTFYQRLVNNGKPKMLAVVAVMKKLLLMVQAILKRKIPFNPDYLPLT
jgi:transposase